MSNENFHQSHKFCWYNCLQRRSSMTSIIYPRSAVGPHKFNNRFLCFKNVKFCTRWFDFLPWIKKEKNQMRNFHCTPNKVTILKHMNIVVKLRKSWQLYLHPPNNKNALKFLASFKCKKLGFCTNWIYETLIENARKPPWKP